MTWDYLFRAATNWPFLIAGVFQFYILIHLIVRGILQNKPGSEFSRQNAKGLEIQVRKLNKYHLKWLAILKLLGIFLPLFYILTVNWQILRFIQAGRIWGNIDGTIFFCTLDQLIYMSQVYIPIIISPWILYTFFSYIFKRQMIGLAMED